MTQTAKAARSYCKPWEAGLASEAQAVAKRIGELYDALDTINANLMDAGPGTLVDDCWEFKMRVRDKLEAEGWRFKVGRGDKWRAIPPTKGSR